MTFKACCTLLVAAVLSAACVDDVPPRLQVETDTVGDTVIATSMGTPDTLALGAPRVLWRSARLERPRAVATRDGGDRIIVGDRTTVHVLTLSRGGLADTTTFGGRGAGPGEFQDVTAIGVVGQDTIGVYDDRLERLTLFGFDGSLLDTRPVPGHPDYSARFRYQPMRLVSGSLLLVMGERGVGPDRDTVALAGLDLARDTVDILAEWEGKERQLVDGGRGLTTTRLFPRYVRAAVGPVGQVAWGNSVDYCVHVFRVSAKWRPHRFCRDRTRTEVGDAIRNPDWSGVEDSGRRETYRRLHAAAEIGARLPSYDRLMWSEDGDLWVRTLGPEMAGVHPYLGTGPNGPSYREWDVFDGGAGDLRFTVRVPPAFSPQLVIGSSVYGFLELPTGEIAIGAAELPS